MEIRLTKRDGFLVPFDSVTEDWLLKKHEGQYFTCDISTPRSYKFHKKLFKLLTITFDHWNPEPLTNKHGIVEKNFEQYREDITILAGYYEQTFRLDGSVKVRAKSISFAKMEQEEFDMLYDKILTVIIQKVLVGFSIEQVDELVGGFL